MHSSEARRSPHDHCAGERERATHDTEWWQIEAHQKQPPLQAEFEASAAELRKLVLQATWLVDALGAARDALKPSGSAANAKEASWCIAAGAIRSTVWNELHGFHAVPPEEIDLVHFSKQAPPQWDTELSAMLGRELPQFRWDVVNQVHAHRLAVSPNATPFVSLEHAMACWPETATAVGVSLGSDGQLRVIAPLGLSDLFGLVLRRGPLLRDADAFTQRLRSKRFLERWPLLRLA